MNSLVKIKKWLYPLAGAMVLAWSVIFLIYNKGGIFHLLLVTGVILFVMRVLQQKNSNY